jgi:hypothetical protein
LAVEKILGDVGEDFSIRNRHEYGLTSAFAAEHLIGDKCP